MRGRDSYLLNVVNKSNNINKEYEVEIPTFWTWLTNPMILTKVILVGHVLHSILSHRADLRNIAKENNIMFL